MSLTLLLQITITTIILCSIFIIASMIFLKYVLTPYRTQFLDQSFEELLIVLNAAIQTELDLFEKDVFQSKQAITNSNFDNYYEEISRKIIDSLSPTFYISIQRYLSYDAVITLIARKVKVYLTGKVNGSV